MSAHDTLRTMLIKDMGETLGLLDNVGDAIKRINVDKLNESQIAALAEPMSSLRLFLTVNALLLRVAVTEEESITE
jgi:hypothetical protein